MNKQETVAKSAGLTRRTVLKRGALVGGAAVWAVPTVQAIAMSGAHATTPSGGGGGGGGGGSTVGKIPSHAIFLISKNGTTYGFKIDVSSGSPSSYFDKIPGPDASFLATKGYALGTNYISDPTNAGWQAALAALAGHGAPGTDANHEAAIVLTLPAGYSFVTGYAFDGGLQMAPATSLHAAGSKYQGYVAATNNGVVVAYLFYGAGH